MLEKFEKAIVKPQKNKEELAFKDSQSANLGVARLRKDISALYIQKQDTMQRMKLNHKLAMGYLGDQN